MCELVDLDVLFTGFLDRKRARDQVYGYSTVPDQYPLDYVPCFRCVVVALTNNVSVACMCRPKACRVCRRDSCRANRSTWYVKP